MISGKQKIKKDDWRTPDWLFSQLHARFNFTVDAAADPLNDKIDRFFADGLREDWNKERVFCNPPFSQKKDWIVKAYKEVSIKKCPLCVMILPNCIDTQSFNHYIHKNFHWEHLPSRVSFWDENNKPISGNPSGTIIVYFWKEIIK